MIEEGLKKLAEEAMRLTKDYLEMQDNQDKPAGNKPPQKQIDRLLLRNRVDGNN